LLNELQDYLRSLQASGTRHVADEHPAIVQIRNQAAGQTDWSRFADDLLEQLIGSLGRDRIWGQVWRHGDFAPWNIFRNRGSMGGRLCAVDWEEGAPEGFPGLDLAYFLLQTASLMHRWTPDRSVQYALDAMAVADPESYGGSDGAPRAIAIVRLSALDAWLRNEAWVSGNFLQRCRWAVWMGRSE
jgi:hypothetical protein